MRVEQGGRGRKEQTRGEGKGEKEDRDGRMIRVEETDERLREGCRVKLLWKRDRNDGG